MAAIETEMIVNPSGWKTAFDSPMLFWNGRLGSGQSVQQARQTLGLGIGGNLAILNLCYQVLLK